MIMAQIMLVKTHTDTPAEGRGLLVRVRSLGPSV